MSFDTKFRKYFQSSILMAALFMLNPMVLASTDVADNFSERLFGLTDKSFKKKISTVKALFNVKDKRVLPVMKAMLESRLYYIKESKKIVYLEKLDSQYRISDVINDADLGDISKSKLKKINTTNKLRKILRGLIAEINLSSADVSVRLKAIKEIISNMDEEAAIRLNKLLAKEPDADVKELMALGVAMVEVASDDKAKQLAAVSVLGDSLLSDAHNLLKETSESTNDVELKRVAEKALSKIESSRKFYSFIETTFFGISLGTVLLLIAVGLAITFGVMGVINMAHGELMMLGAYTTYVIQQLMPNHIDISIFVAIPAAFLVAGLVGIAIERGVIRFLYGRPLETLLATFGISLVLQQIVRSIFSPLNRAVETPSWMSGSLEINGALSLTYNRLYIIVFALLVFTALLVVLKKTKLGLQVRAVSQNRDMAKAMGIRTEWVDAMTFGLGSGIAGVAGVALSQLTNVGPNLGQTYIVDSFMVVVFGGVGNLWGTLVGALSLGVFNKFLEPWAGAVLAKILVLVFIILFIQKRPRGLFPQKGRAAEN